MGAIVARYELDLRLETVGELSERYRLDPPF
jgi:hypothetical protein